jgi:hypothetical protein
MIDPDFDPDTDTDTDTDYSINRVSPVGANK